MQAAREAGQAFAQKSAASAGPPAAAPVAQEASQGAAKPGEQVPAAGKKKTGAPMPPMPTAAQQKVPHSCFFLFFFFRDGVCVGVCGGGGGVGGAAFGFKFVRLDLCCGPALCNFTSFFFFFFFTGVTCYDRIFVIAWTAYTYPA